VGLHHGVGAGDRLPLRLLLLLRDTRPLGDRNTLHHLWMHLLMELWRELSSHLLHLLFMHHRLLHPLLLLLHHLMSHLLLLHHVLLLLMELRHLLGRHLLVHGDGSTGGDGCHLRHAGSHAHGHLWGRFNGRGFGLYGGRSGRGSAGGPWLLVRRTVHLGQQEHLHLTIIVVLIVKCSIDLRDFCFFHFHFAFFMISGGRRWWNRLFALLRFLRIKIKINTKK
jgi:hypothetical protein